MTDACLHDWTVLNPAVRVCTLCGRTEYDPTPPPHISNDQAAALGFARNASNLLQAKFWTFPEDAFRRYGT